VYVIIRSLAVQFKFKFMVAKSSVLGMHPCHQGDTGYREPLFNREVTSKGCASVAGLLSRFLIFVGYSSVGGFGPTE